MHLKLICIHEHFDLITNPSNINVRCAKFLHIHFKKLCKMQNAIHE